MERCIIVSRIFFKLDFFSDFGICREIHNLQSIIGAVAEYCTRMPRGRPESISGWRRKYFLIVSCCNKLYFIHIEIKRGIAKLRWTCVWGGGGVRAAHFFPYYWLKRQMRGAAQGRGARPKPTGQRIVSHILERELFLRHLRFWLPVFLRLSSLISFTTVYVTLPNTTSIPVFCCLKLELKLSLLGLSFVEKGAVCFLLTN